ncbi:hypothetical protein [Thermoanaerobacterium sp. DL9XJH110]|uniref:hypothetical protein n=1 Tax=Thermoanaerobacterium sp. DL9XJH110 TaxID=3386643 RepID=UPI003BB56BC1
MTKEELEKALSEVEAQRNLIKKELKKFEETGGTLDYDKEGDKKGEKNEGPATMAAMTKNILRQAIATGNLKNTMERISGSLDFAKTTVTTFSQIVEKAQEKLEGKTEEIMGAGGITFRSDMWVPMFLSLMQTQEFQHLIANMLVQIIKEG